MATFTFSELAWENCTFNTIAYGILRLSQLGGGGDFYPTPQKTMLKLFDWFEIWYT